MVFVNFQNFTQRTQKGLRAKDPTKLRPKISRSTSRLGTSSTSAPPSAQASSSSTQS